MDLISIVNMTLENRHDIRFSHQGTDIILVLRIPPQDLGQSRFLMDGELDTGGKARMGTEYQYLVSILILQLYRVFGPFVIHVGAVA
ncbi:hypothetical protein FOXB_05801 [Fusarium oxysporum f. sp. conglutinans Fo5176]|uniref:Uncharacterized protein n=1 Tax=Fusarium oxysporum (strain Fo5176) TaxID=660025 RepID=F9FHC2_FUSOF|nr:hypothetical protein FOXB_05801 [Fusarium oxysporum f. sp. conglutinans Fo5176]